MNEVCSGNRFEIIEKAKMDLLESTNINTDKEEMKVLDNFLFRCWQMGWLKKYEQPQANCSRREWYQRGYQDGLNADKWIPCEERLPSESKEYLVTHKEIKDGKIRYRTNYDVFNATTRKWNKVEVLYSKLEVVAWQEDILPYEETKEREEKCEFEEAFPRSNDYICKKTALICTAEKLKYCKYKQPYKKEGVENGKI